MSYFHTIFKGDKTSDTGRPKISKRKGTIGPTPLLIQNVFAQITPGFKVRFDVMRNIEANIHGARGIINEMMAQDNGNLFLIKEINGFTFAHKNGFKR